MKSIDLNGAWTLRQARGNLKSAAWAPGCVHTDLLAAGRIPDPFDRDNEDAVRWIPRETWLYRREFRVSPAFLGAERILLVCNGLDTFAAIRINGRCAGSADNAFRVWEFDVKRLLKPGTNSIEVRFDSALERIRRKRVEYGRVPSWIGPPQEPGGNLVRKSQCNFGWDWGPTLVTCGIWRDIELLGFDKARIADMSVRQRHEKRKVRLEIGVGVDRVSRGRLRAAVLVSFGGRVLARAETILRGRKAVVSLTVENPRLWWPNGLGDQPLYEVTADLLDGDGELLDTCTKRVGLRTLNLERNKDRWGESFRFACNGVPFFAKGANWIPADAFVTRLGARAYRRLLADAAAAHMNMLRVWGGGIYEQDVFYDLCDELGICVWQDFMFACAAYPTFDKSFMANVRAEAADNIRRIRHHPCVALWCGNNELEQGLVGERWTDRTMSWADYGKLFDKLLPALVRDLDPERPYWPGSPHSPHGRREEYNNQNCGDAHLWDVWHKRKPFEWYRTCLHRFCSEFGFQSFPEPRTVSSYARPGDRNITSPVMEHHQRHRSGNANITQYMLDWFRMPKDFEATLWLSQILQALAIKCAVEHWRRNMPRCMGALYWQLNDCWPVASWSSIDYCGRWKALHYAARKFFAPALASGFAESGKLRLFVTNDRGRPLAGKLRCTLTNAAGAVVYEAVCDARVGPRRSACVAAIDAARFLGKHGARNLMAWLELSEKGSVVSSDVVTFAKPKQIELRDPELGCKAARAAGSAGHGAASAFVVAVHAKRPALWTWLELRGADASFSDNFFHVRPGVRRAVLVRPERDMSLEKFKAVLKVRSLFNTF